jgi:hypothetical protein
MHRKRVVSFLERAKNEFYNAKNMSLEHSRCVSPAESLCQNVANNNVNKEVF